MKERVYVGLSGGVDSAVSASILKERGYAVTGAFIKIWQPEFIECTWQKDRLDAMRVCAHLGIPFKEIDLSEEYKRFVIDETIRGYREGVTPNPDVLCNGAIKFGVFAEWAFKDGAQMIATGHYARASHEKGAHLLLRGLDREKDQSYFLWRMPRDVLAKTLFPVGSLTKREVRSRARSLGLPVAEKPDSQGLCFVGDVEMRDFLKRFMDTKEGEVVNERGRVVGTHEGAVLYTPGQRHGFRMHDAALAERPHYVVAIHPNENRIVVSDTRSTARRAAAGLADVRWLIDEPTLPFKTDAQARYREETAPCIVNRGQGGVAASFSEPRLLSAGQSLVFYDGDVCLGGGVILPRAIQRVSVESEHVKSSEGVQSTHDASPHSESGRGGGVLRPVEA